MKVILNVLYALVLVILTELYLEYVLNADYVHILLVFLATVVMLALWVVFLSRIIRELINYLNKQKEKKNDN